MRLSATRPGSQTAPPLPQPYAALRDVGVILRRGQQSLTVAAPGVGKSVLLTNLAVRMKVPTLYLSADSNHDTVKQRVIAILSGKPLAQVESNLTDETWQQYFEITALPGGSHIDWQFDTQLSVERINRRVSAYTEIHGQSPHLIVIDNLRDAVESGDGERSYGGFEETQKALRELARLTNAHVATLHHATGEFENGDKMIPLGGVEGKLGKLPEMVISLWRNGVDEIGVLAPKNRSGVALARTTLQVNLATATVYGYEAIGASV